MFFLPLLMVFCQLLHSQFVFNQTLSYSAHLVKFSQNWDYAILSQSQLINRLLYDGTSYTYHGQIYIPSTIEAMSYEGEKLVETSGDDIFEMELTVTTFNEVRNVTVASDIIDIQIHSTGMMAVATLDGKLFIVEGSAVQQISTSTLQLNCVAISEDQSVVVVGGQQQELFFYGRQLNGSYTLSHTVALGMVIKMVAIADERIFATGASSSVMVYHLTNFSQIQNITTTLPEVNKLSADEKGETISILSNDSLQIYKYNHNDSSFVFLESVVSGVPDIKDVSLSSNGAMMIVTVLNSHAEVYVGCNVPDCFTCASQNVCLTCQHGVDEANNCLAMPKTIPQTNSNLSQSGSRCYRYERHTCMEYCPEECQTCDQKKECLSCSEYYQMSEEGKCELESVWQNVLIIANACLHCFRFRHVRFLFFAADNFWLYAYHRHNYTWLAQNIFTFIRLIENKKEEIIDPKKLSFINQKILPTFPNYYPYANEKYKEMEGKDSFFFRSTLEYFIMGVPYTVVVFVLLNRLFYCLFEYEVSKHLRMFSFWGFLCFMGLESNIELFTFLGFRNFHTMFSFNFAHKVYLSLMLFFMFFVVLFAVGGFFLMYYLYGKLAKYFLDNLYRIKGAFFLMTYVYGLRPFVKGVIHSELYYHSTAQLVCLTCVEFSVCLVMVGCQIRNGVYIFKLVFLFDLVFYFCLGLFNLLLLFSIHTSLEENMETIDHYLYAIMIAITISTLMRFILNLVMCRSIVEKKPEKNEKLEIVLIEKQGEETKQQKKEKGKKKPSSKQKFNGQKSQRNQPSQKKQNKTEKKIDDSRKKDQLPSKAKNKKFSNKNLQLTVGERQVDKIEQQKKIKPFKPNKQSQKKRVSRSPQK